jgi:hypothetical protein
MLLEPIYGIVVSDGYGDFLDTSLSYNRPLFSRCVVVTSPKDKESQRVAGKHNCELVITEDGGKTGSTHDAMPEFGVDSPITRAFNKGAMIERGLQQLPQRGWRLHFDSDVVFPGNIRQRLGDADLDPSCIYGCDRMNVLGWDGWQKLLASGWASKGFEHHHFLTHSINRHEIGSRLIYGDQGWVPIGFFQLWHSSAEYSGIYRTRPYPTGSNNAAHDDVQFALRFDRKKRIFLPEFMVAHLCTEDTSYGKNWNGRITKKFGPPDKKEDPRKESGKAELQMTKKPLPPEENTSNSHCQGSGPVGPFPTWGELKILAKILGWQSSTVVFLFHITWGRIEQAALKLKWNDNTPLTIANLIALFREVES